MTRDRKPTYAQYAKATRELLAALDVFRREGKTRESALEMVASMWDFNVEWAERARRLAARAAEPGQETEEAGLA